MLLIVPQLSAQSTAVTPEGAHNRSDEADKLRKTRACIGGVHGLTAFG